MNRGRDQQGFTLLEVIIAFVILSLVLGAALEIFSTGIASARRVGDYAGAIVRAEAMLDELGQTRRIEPGVSVGRFDDSYAWRMDVRDVSEVADDGSGVNEIGVEGNVHANRLYAVTLTMSWEGGIGAREVELNTHRTVAAAPLQ